MNKKETILAVIGIFILVFVAQFAAIWVANGKSNTVSRFNLSSDRIVKDLDGRAVSMILNQVWPFDASQNIDVQVIAKKQADEFVVVVVEVKALAPVQQAEIPKEQFSTTTTSKDVPKTAPKLPSKLRLNGRMKLTYELVDNDWYLIGADNLNLKATPLD